MSCPAKLEQVIKQFKKATTELTNDQIIMMAGGTDGQWGNYLKGPRVQAIINAVNIELALENYEIVSSGINTRRWRMVTCAEARTNHAHKQVRKATKENNLQNAKNNMWAVARDERASKQHREHAQTWLALIESDFSEREIGTFKSWAEELLRQLPKPPDISSA